MAVEQPQPDRHRDERDGDAREQLEDQRGEERELERRHRRPPVALGDRSDRLDLRLRPAEHLQRREPAHDVEEVPGEHLERAQLSILPALHPHPDQRHEDRDERDGHRDDEGGDPVGGAHRDDHGDRHDHREHELRQVPREVAVERVDPMGSERREMPVGIVASGRRIGSELLDESDSERGLDLARRAVRRHLRVPGDGRAKHHHDQQRGERCTDVADVDAVVERPRDDRREQPRLCDDERGCERAESDRDPEVHARRSTETHEPGVDRTPSLRHRPGVVRGMRHGSPLPRRAHTGHAARATRAPHHPRRVMKR